jgi:hypothetical protein
MNNFLRQDTLQGFSHNTVLKLPALACFEYRYETTEIHIPTYRLNPSVKCEVTVTSSIVEFYRISYWVLQLEPSY